MQYGTKQILYGVSRGKKSRCRRDLVPLLTPYNIYLNIKQLDTLNFIMSLFQASTCFEQTYSSSGGQNCTIQPLVSSDGTATYRCDDTRGCIVQFWPPDDEYVCSKHVEA